MQIVAIAYILVRSSNLNQMFNLVKVLLPVPESPYQPLTHYCYSCKIGYPDSGRGLSLCFLARLFSSKTYNATKLVRKA
jgi:hypothetical protein